MLEIAEKDNFELSENIFLQRIDELGKYWAFNVDTGEHFSMNESSYWILEQVANNLPTMEILSQFLGFFDVDEILGKNDFFEIIANFVNEGILIRRQNYEEGEEKGL